MGSWLDNSRESYPYSSRCCGGFNPLERNLARIIYPDTNIFVKNRIETTVNYGVGCGYGYNSWGCGLFKNWKQAAVWGLGLGAAKTLLGCFLGTKNKVTPGSDTPETTTNPRRKAIDDLKAEVLAAKKTAGTTPITDELKNAWKYQIDDLRDKYKDELTPGEKIELEKLEKFINGEDLSLGAKENKTEKPNTLPTIDLTNPETLKGQKPEDIIAKINECGIDDLATLEALLELDLDPTVKEALEAKIKELKSTESNEIPTLEEDEIMVGGKKRNIGDIKATDIESMSWEEIGALTEAKAKDILTNLGITEHSEFKFVTNAKLLTILSKADIEVKFANNTQAGDKWICGKISNLELNDDKDKVKSYQVKCSVNECGNTQGNTYNFSLNDEQDKVTVKVIAMGENVKLYKKGVDSAEYKLSNSGYWTRTGVPLTIKEKTEENE